MTVLKTIAWYKLKIIIFFFSFSFLIIFLRLLQLQIQLGDLFLHKSTKNFERIETINSPRGNILDCNGILLATNRPVHNVFWKGTGNRQLTPKQKKNLQHLEKIINKPLLDNKKLILQIKKSEQRYQKKLILSDISFEQLSQLEEKFTKQNIIIETAFKRFYPYESYASHILGYLGRINFDFIGKTGLEEIFENNLKGKHGALLSTINSLGRKLNETTLDQALSGANIKTTINIKLQTIVETIFPKEETGTCIIMDTNTGGILTMLSRPNFNPSIFLAPISHKSWQSLQNQKPFLNRAINASYPPGSIFKLVVTSAALEKGIITPETIWDCKGYITFAGRRYHCHEQHGHGKLTVSEALEQSCNPLFYDIGTKLSIDTLADYAHRFGLGEKTNIIFSEKTGLIPTNKWKMETKGERWWPGETLSAAVGQSFLLVTPMQIARMIASIFSGALINPRILESEPIIKKPLDIKEETLEFLRQSMKKVVAQGTGKRIGVVKDIEIYAKTSTAQTSALHKRNKGRRYKEHGWIVTHFQYKNYNPMTMVVLVEHAGSSRLPTSIAKNFLIQYKKYVDTKSV
ncbi:penicillin-binding protein 2 [bacterium]|nr:penicillin-binding protein 2 [bacterium]